MKDSENNINPLKRSPDAENIENPTGTQAKKFKDNHTLSVSTRDLGNDVIRHIVEFTDPISLTSLSGANKFFAQFLAPRINKISYKVAVLRQIQARRKMICTIISKEDDEIISEVGNHSPFCSIPFNHIVKHLKQIDTILMSAVHDCLKSIAEISFVIDRLMKTGACDFKVTVVDGRNLCTIDVDNFQLQITNPYIVQQIVQHCKDANDNAVASNLINILHAYIILVISSLLITLSKYDAILEPYFMRINICDVIKHGVNNYLFDDNINQHHRQLFSLSFVDSNYLATAFIVANYTKQFGHRMAMERFISEEFLNYRRSELNNHQAQLNSTFNQQNKYRLPLSEGLILGRLQAVLLLNHLRKLANPWYVNAVPNGFVESNHILNASQIELLLIGLNENGCIPKKQSLIYLLSHGAHHVHINSLKQLLENDLLTFDLFNLSSGVEDGVLPRFQNK